MTLNKARQRAYYRIFTAFYAIFTAILRKSVQYATHKVTLFQIIQNMAACASTSRLLRCVRRRVCRGASALRVFSCAAAAARFQLHREDGAAQLTGKVDRFGGVTVNLGEIGLPADISESAFSRLLQCGRKVLVSSANF